MAFTGEILWSPILNSIKFINSLDDSFLDFESLEDTSDLEWMNMEGYCQKVQIDEIRTIQFHSNGTTPTVYIKDWITDAIISTVVASDLGASTKEGEDGLSYAFNFYQADLSFPIVGNFYCSIENTAGGTIRSEPISVGDFPNTLLLSFTNRENTGLNIWIDGLKLNIRVEAQLFRRQPSSERTVFRGSDNRGQVLSQRNVRGMRMDTFFLPAYLHEALAYGWSLTKCAINGQSFYSEEGYEIAGYFDRYTLSNGSVAAITNQGMDQAIKAFTPPTPSGLVATRMTFCDIDLEWVSNNDGPATPFTVQVSTDNIAWLDITSVGPGVLTANVAIPRIPGVGNTYYYRVIADGAEPSLPSNVAIVTTEAAPVVLDPITLVTTSTIDLSWTDTEGFASTYALQRATTIGGTYADIVITTNTSFRDTGLDDGTEYFYRVQVREDINSDFSSIESAYTATIYESAAIIYSVRRAVSNQSKTSAFEIRRDSDNEITEWLLPSTPNTAVSLTDLVSAGGTVADWVGANNAFITKWYNQGTELDTNSADTMWFRQAVTAQQPRIIAAGVLEVKNGMPKPNFKYDGVTYSSLLLNGSSFTPKFAFTDVGNDFSIFTVANNDVLATLSGMTFTLGESTTAVRITIPTSGTVSGVINPTVINASSVRNSIDQRQISLLVDGTAKTASEWDNGAAGDQDVVWTTYGNGRGFMGVQATSLSPLDGGVQEVVIFAGLKTSDRTTIESDQDTFYSIP